MGLKRWIAERWAHSRAKAIRRVHENAVASQHRTLKQLIYKATNTQFGQDHGFAGIASPADFRARVPVRNYEAGRKYFDAIRDGQSDVTWPGKPLYLAKTSGTTSGAKYIPITRDSIRYQIKGARDALLLYIHETGNSAFLDGRMMFLSGSPVLDTNDHGLKVGRLSGIVNHFVPSYLRRNQVPTYATNCIEEWEQKVDKILDETLPEDLRLISGIPPWVQMYFERLEERTGEKPLERWPNLSLFAQGGVDFSPYEGVFRNYFDERIDILELFPASEGFFALQDKMPSQGLLLNLAYGMYYEFIPMAEYGNEHPTRLGLEDVELDTQYALIVSSNAGLWAYDIGDTVKFVSKNPHRLKVTGRVKHFISAFGEHVIVEEVNRAMIHACEQHGAEIVEFTVAPQLAGGEGDSFHEWLVEFRQSPPDEAAFSTTLDAELRRQNSYYDDLRNGNMLRAAVVRKIQLNATREYMRAIGKLGGQNKFPRLSNNRKIADWLQDYVL
ncbi:MAG: GH3 auxin-responsive promoter family protein [Bacteroidota bacterium]